MGIGFLFGVVKMFYKFYLNFKKEGRGNVYTTI